LLLNKDASLGHLVLCFHSPPKLVKSEVWLQPGRTTACLGQLWDHITWWWSSCGMIISHEGHHHVVW